MKLLTGIVITYNEEAQIEKCLTSLLPVVDEVVVVDSYSTDDTVAICQSQGVNPVLHEYTGQVEQKQYALSLANTPYVLSIDADEELSHELQQSILKEKKEIFPKSIYMMSRRTKYCGKWIKHGGWGPTWKIRLWEQSKAAWTGNNPHDKITPYDKMSSPGYLQGSLFHYAFDKVSEHKRQMPGYADIAAAELSELSPTRALLGLIFSPIVKFLRDYLFRLGFLDGKVGLTVASLSFQSKMMKYWKLVKTKF